MSLLKVVNNYDDWFDVGDKQGLNHKISLQILIINKNIFMENVD